MGTLSSQIVPNDWAITRDQSVIDADDINDFEIASHSEPHEEGDTVIDKQQLLPTNNDETTRLQATITRLSQQINDLFTENTHLEEQIVLLNDALRMHDVIKPKPVNGFFTMEYFLATLTAKLHRSYGWRTDYIRASHETPGCTVVRNETVQVWQNKNEVPEWAVEQIDRLTFKKRPKTSGTTWTHANEIFLIERYRADPHQSNATLADICSGQFNRAITENSIKGALDRARKRGLLEEYRPRKTIG